MRKALEGKCCQRRIPFLAKAPFRGELRTFPHEQAAGVRHSWPCPTRRAEGSPSGRGKAIARVSPSGLRTHKDGTWSSNSVTGGCSRHRCRQTGIAFDQIVARKTRLNPQGNRQGNDTKRADTEKRRNQNATPAKTSTAGGSDGDIEAPKRGKTYGNQVARWRR